MAVVQVPPAVGTSGQFIDSIVITSSTNRQIVVVGSPTSTSAHAAVDTASNLHVVTASSGLVQISGNITSTATTITSGTVTLSSAIAISSGTITLSSATSLSSGTVTLSSAIALSSGTVTLSSAIAISSGTVTSTAATNPWSSAPSFNVPVINASSGSLGTFPSTSRQYLVFVFNSSSSNSFTTITTSQAVLYGWNVGNQTTSGTASVKIFNTSSGTAGSTAQLTVTIPLPGGSAGAGNNLMLPQGVSCTGGISFLITANFAATSTGSVAAGDVVGTLYYNT